MHTTGSEELGVPTSSALLVDPKVISLPTKESTADTRDSRTPQKRSVVAVVIRETKRKSGTWTGERRSYKGGTVGFVLRERGVCTSERFQAEASLELGTISRACSGAILITNLQPELSRPGT